MSMLEVTDLRVELESSGAYIVDGVSLRADAGETVALVGESGSGKTTTGVALLGYARAGARIAAGTVRAAGEQLVPAPSRSVQGLRGSLVSYVPQDPSVALNPSLRIRTQLQETLAAHGIGAGRQERSERVLQLLDDVRLPTTREFLSRFPHQLSGGQQQRVCIAMAVACEPKVLVLDEPTTGLDVTTQAHVLKTLDRLVTENGMAAIYVTHDLAVVANIANRVLVMYSGRIVEEADCATLFRRPAHPYTAKLMGALPDIARRRTLDVIPGRAPAPTDRPAGCAFAPRCALAIPACEQAEPQPASVGDGHLARCIRIPVARAAASPEAAPAAVAPEPGRDVVLSARDVCVSYGETQVLHEVSFDLVKGECLALVGESGSGKTTLSRTLVGLVSRTRGAVRLGGAELPADTRQFADDARRSLQYIFQSPYAALNPRRTVGATLATPVRHFFGLKGTKARAQVIDALDRVSLAARVVDLFPDQLSGGERQRVAIARALVCKPQVLLCDEITSALDVSVQAAVVDLLIGLQREQDLSLLFVTHDMGLVRSIADRVAVMSGGRIVEAGAAESVITEPQDTYTRELVGSTPTMEAVLAGA